MFSFQWPWVFVGVFLPLFIYRYWQPVPRRQSALTVPFYAKIKTAETTFSHSLDKIRACALMAIWLLVLVAAAKPVWLGEPEPVKTSPRDLMLAVDISGSMNVKDMQLGDDMVNRLTGIKVVLDGFIKRRNQDRMGLILFADNAYIQTPLTLDHKTLAQFLQEAQIGFAGQNTAIGDAIGLALKRMQNKPEKSKVLVLLTDGANTAGSVTPLDAAKVAAEQGLKIYTLGFGADELIVDSFFGSRSVNPSADLDETTLSEIAELTGGKYFRARSINELVEIYQLLDDLEPQPLTGKVVVPQKSLFYWPLGMAIILSLLWFLITVSRQYTGMNPVNRQEGDKSVR